MKDKAKMIPATPVGEIVAHGDAEIGFQQISELKPVNGIDIVGPLPADLQKITVFSAGIATVSKEPEAGKALIKFLDLAGRQRRDREERPGADPRARRIRSAIDISRRAVGSAPRFAGGCEASHWCRRYFGRGLRSPLPTGRGDVPTRYCVRIGVSFRPLLS